MSKKLVSPSGDLTKDLVLFIASLWQLLFQRECRMPEGSSPFFPYEQNQGLREMHEK